MDLSRVLRPRVLALLFGIYFLVIALSAAVFASGLKGAWYREELSRWVYVGYLVTAAVFLSGTAVAAAVGFGRFGSGTSEEAPAGHSPARGREPPAPTPGASVARSNAPREDTMDHDIDELLESLQEMETRAEEVEEEEPRKAAEVPATRPAEETATAKGRSPAALFMLGPAVASAVIVGICAALLPGVNFLLQSYHQLNTAIILGIGYSYGGLAAYTALSTYAMFRSA